jgi:hypothetical protein
MNGWVIRNGVARIGARNQLIRLAVAEALPRLAAIEAEAADLRELLAGPVCDRGLTAGEEARLRGAGPRQGRDTS